MFVEQEQAFRHAVEDRILPHLELKRGLLVAVSQALDFALEGAASGRKLLAPVKVKKDQRRQRGSKRYRPPRHKADRLVLSFVLRLGRINSFNPERTIASIGQGFEIFLLDYCPAQALIAVCACKLRGPGRSLVLGAGSKSPRVGLEFEPFQARAQVTRAPPFGNGLISNFPPIVLAR